MTRTGEHGVALVFTLFLMAALSAMAVSIMFLAQTETSASRNYKTMSQARYAGEAGVHRAIHYLSSTTYTSLVTNTTGFDTTVSPVTYSGNPVVLAAVATDSNHPSTTIKSAYAALFSGASLSVGSGATVTYAAKATLISMRQVTVYGGTSGVVQTWRIEATGTVPGALAATVEVAALLERDSTAAETYAIFATGSGCGAITMTGNVRTDSYDSNSMTMSGGAPVTQSAGGSVGTNGNLSIAGQVNIAGNLDTPRTGVGNCTNGNITALTQTGQANVSGDTIQLPQAKTYPTPALPSPLPPTTNLSITSSTTCLSLSLYISFPVTCSSSAAGNITLNSNGGTISLGNVTLSGGSTLTIDNGTSASPVTVNVNSFIMAGNSNLILGTDTSVTMNVVGTGVTGDVVDFTGGSFSNATFDPSKFQILYAGTGTMKYTGGNQTAATVYAPNASVSMDGSGNFYGSILSRQFTDTGGASVHYDRSLASKFTVLGNHVMSSFSWQKY
ncbi:MAG TPA: PilX N-terminal domain-containing pilus assembly protein [Vicinamibacterales bacterium]|nr:PilX N-terminal domain-containing pilus assembly protein [Vicinamibacterales bacterium]